MLRAGFTKRNVSAIALLLMGLSCSASSNGGKSSPEHGGSSNAGQPTTSGGTQAAGGTDNAALGGRLGQGGFVASGGAQQQRGGASSAGGSPSGGSSNLAQGGSDARGGSSAAAGSYALAPPSACHNQDYIDFQEGCIEGKADSVCGGKCNTINACLESSAEKPHADVTFICPRFMLFSDQMQRAAEDDGNSAFNYAVVGHDVDHGGIDGDAQSTCCQCYQLVYAYPSPSNDRQVLTNPDNPNPPISAIPLPKPLIVQSFNTAATPHTFDVYMAAGGLGANNACAPGLQPAARSGQYLYTSYPADGQPSQGGVKPVSLYSECKTNTQWVTTDSLSSEACQTRVAAACDKLSSPIAGLTEQARRSCRATTSPDSQYHLNWSVYVMKVECPAHLTEVTGCKLAPQGLPAVDRSATSAAAAQKNSAFWTKSTGGQPYETTTMEDCCRPSCASKDWVSGKGLRSDPDYNAFYSCDATGKPITN